MGIETSAQPYQHLFSSFQLGSLTLKNRIVMLPMGARLSSDGLVSDSDVAWLEERARGGVGLIVTGGQIVSPSAVVPASMDGRPGNVYRLVEAFRSDGVDAQRTRVDAVHRHGAKIIGQLVHQGRDNSFQSGLSSEAPVLAPSPLRTPGASDTPHELTAHEIDQIVEEFAVSAGNLLAAGFDGVELHGAHGYLIAQFLSPLANVRSDAYGVENVENQTRFLREIIAAIRSRCGREMVLGVRLSADEEIPGGLDVEATVRIVRQLEQQGLIDYISISRATRGNYVKDGSTPHGAARESASVVKASTTLPVIVASRITTPALADEIVANGEADLVGLGRALIADPDFVNKAGGVHPGSIRPCIGFVQDCRQSVGGILCGVNAGASRELLWPSARTSTPQKRLRVGVVGGGPGGLEAARVAAELGHDVILWEQSEQVGGQVVTASKGPHRVELMGLIEFQVKELARLGVVCHVGHTATSEDLADHSLDLAVLATGSVAESPLPSSEGVPLVSTWQLLADGRLDAEPGSAVFVVDDGTGFWPVASSAELLADAGFAVTVVGPHAAVMQNIPAESAPGLHRRLRAQGTTYLPFTRMAGFVESECIVLQDVTTGLERTERVGAVVLQTPRKAVTTPFDFPAAVALREVGDRVSPRRISHAILEANKAVRSWAEKTLESRP